VLSGNESRNTAFAIFLKMAKLQREMKKKSIEDIRLIYIGIALRLLMSKRKYTDRNEKYQ